MTSPAAGPRGSPPRPGITADDGAQAVEFALVVPFVMLLLLLVVAAGALAVGATRAQGLAHQLARHAARGIGGATLDDLAADTGAQVTVERATDAGAGAVVTVTVRDEVVLPLPGGPSVPVHGRATMPAEPADPLVAPDAGTGSARLDPADDRAARRGAPGS